MRTHRKLLLLILVTLALSGCAPLTKPEQPHHTNLVILRSGESLGQTFVARYDGLQSVAFYLDPATPGQGEIVLHLRSGPGESNDIRSSRMHLQEVDSPGFYHFQFTPIVGSNREYYYGFIRLQGEGSLEVGTANGDAYLNGALYLSHEPQDAQAAFLLGHNRKLALAGLLQEGFTWLAWLLVGLFLYIIPGWALLCSLWPGWKVLHWAEKLGLAGGVSLALYPVLLLWTDLVGLHLGPLYAWLPPLTGLVIIAWRNWKQFITLPGKLRSKNISIYFSLSTLPGPDLALLFSIALIFAVRFWVIRDLDYPMWGDSYQHTMIAQLLADNGGLFDSWQPYAELTTFTYHFGFHSQTAVFHWITQLPMHQAILWVGQILNGMAVIFLFPLALRLNRNPWSGVIAVLIAGLLVPMPMFYVNWGRYTQLAGQAILPAAIYLSWAILETKDNKWRALIPAWIALGGLALTHYRVLIFAVIFFAAFALLQFRKLGLGHIVIRAFWLGLGSGLLFLPWFVHVFAGKILTILHHQITTPPSQIGSVAQGYNSIGDLFEFLPPILWLALPIIIGWGLWRRNKDFAITSLWWYLVFLAANPQWLNLPGAGALSNFAVMIAAYFPASLLVGAAVGWGILDLQEKLAGLTRRENYRVNATATLPLLLCLLLAGLGLWGVQQRRYDINIPKHALVTLPDMRAASWLQENISQEAHFLVNAFFAYGGSSIVGSDAGWWLPLLAGRQTSLPPLTYSSELGPRPDYREQINTLAAEIAEKSINDPNVLNALRELGITYIFLGQQQGSVNSPHSPLNIEQLLASSNFRPVYNRDRVWIFELITEQ